MAAIVKSPTAATATAKLQAAVATIGIQTSDREDGFLNLLRRYLGWIPVKEDHSFGKNNNNQEDKDDNGNKRDSDEEERLKLVVHEAKGRQNDRLSNCLLDNAENENLKKPPSMRSELLRRLKAAITATTLSFALIAALPLAVARGFPVASELKMEVLGGGVGYQHSETAKFSPTFPTPHN